METTKVGNEPQVTIHVESEGRVAAMQVIDPVSGIIRNVFHIRVSQKNLSLGKSSVVLVSRVPPWPRLRHGRRRQWIWQGKCRLGFGHGAECDGGIGSPILVRRGCRLGRVVRTE
jgi:hypothetical protein